MNKFDEICEAYKNSRHEFFDYEGECRKFVVQIVQGLIKYLRCPKEQIKYYPINEEPEKNTEYHIGGAMEFNDNDRFWHIGLGITIYEAPRVYPQETIRAELLIKKVDDQYHVKFGKRGKLFKLPEDDIDNFYNHIYESLLNLYRGDLHQYLNEENTKIRKIE
jgi:hypothetical protein